jgi:hypothetical protein
MASANPQTTSQNDTALSESPLPQLKKVRATANKVGSSKKMTGKEQSEQFIETARMLKVDESAESFSNLAKVILKAKPRL